MLGIKQFVVEGRTRIRRIRSK